jgi:hypothetical protein
MIEPAYYPSVEQNHTIAAFTTNIHHRIHTTISSSSSLASSTPATSANVTISIVSETFAPPEFKLF